MIDEMGGKAEFSGYFGHFRQVIELLQAANTQFGLQWQRHCCQPVGLG